MKRSQYIPTEVNGKSYRIDLNWSKVLPEKKKKKIHANINMLAIRLWIKKD